MQSVGTNGRPPFDVAVVGVGPAGRAIASACLRRGARVLVVDPDPDRAWRPTYGVWADELPDGWSADQVARAVVPQPELRSRTRHPLGRTYVVLDNVAVQQALPLDGATIERATLDDASVRALRARARIVVDARGARPGAPAADRPPDHDPAPAQTAYGIVLPAAAAAPALDGAKAWLMDWRTDWRESEDRHPAHRGADAHPPTFLYAIPVGDDRVLLEETCLAAAPGLPLDELRRRLHLRLLSRGVSPTALDHPLSTEEVHIPMRGRGAPPVSGTLALGTAGRGGNLVTGYSVAHALRTADALAPQILGETPPRTVDPLTPADLVREAGLRALLRLDTEGTLDLFEGFGRLPGADQRAFLSRDSGAGPLLRAMWRMFTTMPPRSKVALARATLGP